MLKEVCFPKLCSSPDETSNVHFRVNLNMFVFFKNLLVHKLHVAYTKSYEKMSVYVVKYFKRKHIV